MIIDIIDESDYLKPNEKELLVEIITATARKLNLSDQIEVDVSIVSNAEIQELNKQYRQIDRPTDVLSFALEEEVQDAPVVDLEGFYLSNQAHDFPRHLGDIIISYAKAVEQAEDYGHSLERELAFLAVHGFLHLNGFDHQSQAEERVMFGLQEKVLAENGYER